jgi:DNA/RNA endonuclease G (NUC1)
VPDFALFHIQTTVKTPINTRLVDKSVDKVEKETGMDFFFQLDDKQEKELEKVCNPGAWGI